MTEELRGTVRKIIFSSDDGRFCVFLLEDKESRKQSPRKRRKSNFFWHQALLTV